jgi:hypothetical protein
VKSCSIRYKAEAFNLILKERAFDSVYAKTILSNLSKDFAQAQWMIYSCLPSEDDVIKIADGSIQARDNFVHNFLENAWCRSNFQWQSVEAE